ncbi:US22 family homolog [Murid betaherpesvirus 1]|uniref:US22 family homolog n=1 Tax=Murid herpesvirus 1 TaxID=10366 RepID=UPI00004EBC35|nr:US22 family homolog [Murid betaherpesvirus 1]
MSWVTGDPAWRPEALIRPADREQILRDFKSFFLTQTSERSLKKTVKRESGTKLCVGYPPGWWLAVVPRGELVEMDGRDLRPILPTGEWVVVLGEIRSPMVQHTSLYLAMGKESRMFVYSAEEDAIALAANDLDEFSRIGLLTVEFIYRVPLSIPLKKDPVWDAIGLCVTGYDLNRHLSTYRNSVIELRTPGKQETNPLILLDRLELCCKYWPLVAMDKSRIDGLIRYASRKMSSRWYTLGLVGVYRDTGVFHGAQLLVFDDSGSIFYLSLISGELWRLADSAAELRRMGLLKIFTAGRRVDRDLAGSVRLEPPPDQELWFHSRPAATHLCVDVAPPGEAQLAQQFAWISRPGRAEILSEEETAVADAFLRLSRLKVTVTEENSSRVLCTHVAAPPEPGRAAWCRRCCVTRTAGAPSRRTRRTSCLGSRRSRRLRRRRRGATTRISLRRRWRGAARTRPRVRPASRPVTTHRSWSRRAPCAPRRREIVTNASESGSTATRPTIRHRPRPRRRRTPPGRPRRPVRSPRRDAVARHRRATRERPTREPPRRGPRRGGFPL